ncbi:MAG: hypothetical protein WDN00_05030 [Limisphaerales bacterium]
MTGILQRLRVTTLGKNIFREFCLQRIHRLIQSFAAIKAPTRVRKNTIRSEEFVNHGATFCIVSFAENLMEIAL